MQVMMGMAGLAEAAFHYLLQIIQAGMWVAAGFLAWSWWRRSLTPLVIGFVILLLAGFLIEPWTIFGPPEFNDLDVAEWNGRFQTAFLIWLLLLIPAAACLIRAVRHRRLKKAADPAA